MKLLFYLTYFSLHLIQCSICVSVRTTTLTFSDATSSNELSKSKFNSTSHLQYDHVKRICTNRDAICKVNNTNVCTVRKVNDTYEFKDFVNSCYLSLSNMCDYPGQEFYIMESQSCNSKLTRRHYVDSGVGDTTRSALSENDTGWDGNTTRPGLRDASFSTLYDIARAADNHPCAESCPALYHPVCMNVNRNYGKYLKFFHFVNHCEGDRFYCMHWKELEAPPGKPKPLIAMSYLDWSYCGAQRYLNFMFMTQSASSMGHYGWLDSEQRYSKILEPWQRKPGYG